MSKSSKLFQELQSALRDLEINVHKFNREVLFEVFQTDATLKPGKLIYQGFNRDIAESTMTRRFTYDKCNTDYILYNHTTNTPLALLLSDKSLASRKEMKLDNNF